MRMKISQIQRVSQPKKMVKQMERAVVKFKPVNAHQEHQAKDKARKEGVRAIRLERDEVVSLLFNAFERHQFYRQADLQRITNQPASVVREVLNDIGLYHDSAPHRSMWALKPEYRNYSKQLARNVEQKLQQQQKQKDDK
uniref:General transcription factor IIF subunit 2 n=1 Tax=Globodera pallida TaxID=36090 RepID=A0A183CAV7_GLOPA